MLNQDVMLSFWKNFNSIMCYVFFGVFVFEGHSMYNKIKLNNTITKSQNVQSMPSTIKKYSITRLLSI